MGFLDRLAAGLVGGEPLTDDAREQIDLALALADRGDLGDAEERLAELARNYPKVVAVRVAQGEVRARRGDHDGAVEAYGRAVDLSVDAVDAWLGLGEALVRLGRRDPAADAFRRVLSASDDPERRARAHAGRGRLALSAGRTAKAVRELRKAAELLPDDNAVSADLGRALVAAREPDGWQWLMRAAQASVSAAAERPAALDVAMVVEAARAVPRRAPAEALLRSALERRQVDALARARLEAALAEQLVRVDPAPAQRSTAATPAAVVAQSPAPPSPGEAGGVPPANDPGRRIAEARTLAGTALAAAPGDAVVLAAWQAVAEATGDYREALRAAARAAELGAPPAPEAVVRLALGAASREEMARAVAALPADHPLGRAARAFLDGTASEDDLVALGVVAPSEASRRFVARAVSPGPPPAGNLFALLAYARDLAARSPELASLLPAAAHAAEAVDRPLLVAVMGEFNAGKSSFVNALCGAEVAPVGVTPTTATINVLRHGPPGGRVLYQDGRARDLGAAEVSDFLGGLGDAEAGAVRMVEIFVPLDVLRRVEIVDTPGLNSLRVEHERVARSFLTDADAIVWLFAVGQAAKATERDALGMAHDAGKRVLGVLNKADQADPAELEAVRAHVAGAMGDRIEALLTLSARDAVRARRRGDEAALAASGMTAVLAALEERFFGEARALKRRTALSALARFVSEAVSHAGGDTGAAAADGDPAAELRRDDALEAQRAALEGALAAERITLRSRLEQAFRQAAGEVLEFVRPRRWPFGERRAEAADEEFLFDLLEDAVAQATEATRAGLEAAAAAGPPVPIRAAIERFRAYARGVLAGGLVERFLHDDLPAAGGRVERSALERALARRIPDVDAELISPLAAEIKSAHASARAGLDAERTRVAMRRLLRQERLLDPVNALALALQEMGQATVPQAPGHEARATSR